MLHIITSRILHIKIKRGNRDWGLGTRDRGPGIGDQGYTGKSWIADMLIAHCSFLFSLFSFPRLQFFPCLLYT